MCLYNVHVVVSKRFIYNKKNIHEQRYAPTYVKKEVEYRKKKEKDERKGKFFKSFIIDNTFMSNC